MTFWEKRKYIKKQLAALEAEEAKKAKLLDKEMDYAFLEELIQQINENPLLSVRITLTDGTVLNLRTEPKKTGLNIIEPHEEFIEVK